MAMPQVIHKNVNKTGLLIQATPEWGTGPRSSAALQTDGHPSGDRRTPGVSLSFTSGAKPAGQLPLVPLTAVCPGTGEPKSLRELQGRNVGHVARCPPPQPPALPVTLHHPHPPPGSGGMEVTPGGPTAIRGSCPSPRERRGPQQPGRASIHPGKRESIRSPASSHVE